MRKEKVYEDVEVHDMSEMGRRSGHRNKGSESGQNGVSVVWKALSVLIAMVALAYDLSPIDAVPDALPVFGWLDDFGFTAMAALNLYQQFAKDQGALTVRLAKYLKWMLIALVVIAGIAVGGLIAAIVTLVTR